MFGNLPEKKYYSISEVATHFDVNTSLLRFWEKEFKQIKPKLVNNRRYYTKETVELIKLIKFLLKDKGLTIKGVKNVLKSDINELDDYNSDSLKASYYKHNFKLKSLKILNKLKNLKKYGKKNTY